MPRLWSYFGGSFLYPTGTSTTITTAITTTAISITTITTNTQQGSWRLVLTTFFMLQCWLTDIWARQTGGGEASWDLFSPGES